MENAIVKILSRIDTNNLPVLPKVLVDLMDAIQHQDVNIETLARIIEQDASISANILAAGNSPYYRQWGEVTDLKKMIQVLGLKTIKTLIMTRAIQQFFARIPIAQQSHLEVIWYQSLTCAHLARNLAQLTAYEFPDEVYLAGLIHRLGQLILMLCFPNEYPEFLSANPEGDPVAEKKLFTVAHYEVGAYVIANWNLQSFIADAVLFQYQAIENILDSARIVKILNIASKLCCVDESSKYYIFGQANQLFGLNQSLVSTMLEEVNHSVTESAESLGLRITRSGNSLVNSTSPERRKETDALIGEHIKNIAFSAAIQDTGNAVVELNKLATTLQRDMSVLFGFPCVALFIYQSETHELTHIKEIQPTLKPLSISLSNQQSLLSKAWHSKRVLHSFNLDKDEAETQINRPIFQLLNSEDMIAFPLIQNQEVLGVIAAGLKRTDVKRIKLNLSFINLFIGEAAKIIQTLKTSTTTAPESLIDLHSNYAIYARKLGHEINNPLSIINNYLYLLSLKLGSEHSDQIRIIQEEIERVSNITLSLSDFSLAPTDTYTAVDLKILIHDLIKLFESGIFNTPVITTKLNLDDALIKVSTNKDKLKQVLTNLIKNAVEAMPDGGEIIISTKAVKTPNGKPAFEIKIQDDGPGIPAEILRHIFIPTDEPKSKYKSGLGLTICKSLVEELKGTIRCESSPDQGTTFYITLPKDI